METNETLSKYYNGCLSKLVDIDLNKYEERFQLDLVSLALLQLSLLKKSN